MRQKMILAAGVFFWGIILFFSYSSASAGIVINEIMYDAEGADEGKEWVEVYNSGPESVDLSEYKFFESGVNHKLTLSQGGALIESQAYAVIVSDPIKFKTDWFTPPELGGASFSGAIFDSSFSLSNDGEALAIKDKNLNTVDQVIYSASMGAGGNGWSISKINGIWKESKSTPGAENQIYFTPSKLTSVLPAVINTPKPEPKKEKINKNKIIAIENSVVENENVVPMSEIKDVSAPQTKTSTIYYIILFFLIILGGGGAYFVRKKVKISLTGDDFEIMEE